MARRSIKNNRRKAPFGSEEAAILAAAGIGVAGTLAAAKIQSNAAKEAAKQQAEAAKSAAKQQADALIRQNENANALQEKSAEFQKEQNEESRDIQKEIQMNLQLLAGGQNHNDRLEASKIQVRNGGKTRRKCLQGSAMQSSLRAGSNIPFVVTDGGGVLPLGSTPEGFNLYEIRGDNHEQYHKARNGYKTGVGFKFADGNVIEGEGGKGSNDGELLLTTPNDAFFISKHSIKGFDPADAVKAGMHPLQAFNTQEQIKNMYGISDSGKQAKFGLRNRKSLGGLQSFDVNQLNLSAPIMDIDLAGGASGGAGYITTQDDLNQAKLGRKTLRCGGRKKAYNGYWGTPAGANWIGAGLTGLGNIGGALISNWGSNKAADYLKDAYRQSGNIIANAYDNLQGINDSELFSRSDFDAAHVMPALRTARYNVAHQLALVDRSLQRQLSSARRGNLSSAAMQDRMSNAEVNAYDQRSRIYDTQQKIEQDIANRNIDSINRAAEFNAQADMQANQAYLNQRMSFAQYNNNIANQRILGRARALSDSLTGIAQTDASLAQTNAGTWGNAIQGPGNIAANTLTTNAKMAYDADQAQRKYEADFNNVWLAADTSGKIDYIATNLNDPKVREKGETLLSTLNPDSDQYKRLSRVLGYNNLGRFDLTLSRPKINTNYAQSLVPNITPRISKFGGNISKRRSLKR